MKGIYIALVVLVCLLNVNEAFGQTPNWAWAKSAGGSGEEIGNSIAVDQFGNSYTTGRFSGAEMAFGLDSLINTSVSSYNFFITKHDSNGNYQWAKSAGGNVDDYGNSIAVDEIGNSYVTGSFKSFSITFGNVSLTNNGFGDIFIVKYNTLGNVIWAKKVGGTALDEGNAITLDMNGNLYITGKFNSATIAFGAITLTNTGNEDIFIAKYDTSGNVIWAKSVGGTDGDSGEGITTDVNGNIFVTGYFYSPTISFGGTILSNAHIFTSDFFIAKYDSSGNCLWAKSAGGAQPDICKASAVDTFGNVYIVGSFASDSITFDNITILKGGYYDIFIVKYDPLGNVIWVRQGGGNTTLSVSEANCIKVDSNGNVLIAGDFGDYPIFFDGTMLISAGDLDIFVLEYDLNGNLIWTTTVGGSRHDDVRGIALDANNNSYFTGKFLSDSINFDGSTLSNSSNSLINSDFYIAKLDSSFAVGISEQNSFSNPITLYPNPTTSQINISSAVIINKIEIADIMGQVIYSATPSDKNLTLQLPRAGIYFVSLTSSSQTITRKVVVQQ